ncbi:MAG: phosphatase PAP2 family protein [Chitinophagales bacterium]|nr:phosphatase PAP2 family protein [Chitinophagales bacterium]
MNTLLQLDRELFFFINQQLQNAFFDFAMPYLRDKNLWIPLYVVMAGWLIYKFRVRSFIIIVSAVITLLLTDQIASSIIKPIVKRLRPCNNPEILNQVRLLVDCGSGFSFVSSHAANHFGFAVFFIVLFSKKFKWLTPFAIAWATLVCFAQVYVGLHYPLDVICGALLGVGIGIITGSFCKTALKKFGVVIA